MGLTLQQPTDGQVVLTPLSTLAAKGRAALDACFQLKPVFMEYYPCLVGNISLAVCSLGRPSELPVVDCVGQARSFKGGPWRVKQH